MLDRCACGWPGRRRGSSCGWKPCDSYRFRPNGTSVCELIDGFAEPLLESSSENCCPMVYRSALHPAVLVQPQPKGSGSPRAHNKPEFGPGVPVPATLRTDWGMLYSLSALLYSCNRILMRTIDMPQAAP